MKIPMIMDLVALGKYKLFSFHQLRGVQNELITMLDFDLMVLTPWHFIEQMFATGVIVSRDQKIQIEKDISEKTMVKVRAYASFLCDIITEQYDIVAKYAPSKIAHACLYYARKCC